MRITNGWKQDEGRSQWRLTMCAMSVVLSAASLAMGAGTERVHNGTFDTDISGWALWTQRGNATIESSNAVGTPTGGAGNALRIHSSNNFAGGVFQPVYLKGGESYTLTGFWKDNIGAGNTGASWGEVWLSTRPPHQGCDFGGGGPIKLANVDATGCDDWDVAFSGSCIAASTTQVIPGSGTQVWYLTIKTGDNGTAGKIDMTVDNVSLIDSTGTDPVMDSIGSLSNASFQTLWGTANTGNPDNCDQVASSPYAMSGWATTRWRRGTPVHYTSNVELDAGKPSAERCKFEIYGSSSNNNVDHTMVKEIEWGAAPSVNVSIWCAGRTWAGNKEGTMSLGIVPEGRAAKWSEVLPANKVSISGSQSRDEVWRQLTLPANIVKPGGATTFTVLINANRSGTEWNCQFDELSVTAGCTPPAVPGAPTVSNTGSQTELDLTNNAGDSGTDFFAFKISPMVGGNEWVQADGSIGAAAVYQTKATWGTVTLGAVGTALNPGTTYTVTAQSSTDAGGTCVSAFSAGGSDATDPCGSTTELLTNGDFENRTAVNDYDDWTEIGTFFDNPTSNNNGWADTSCSGGHGNYSPALSTWPECSTNPLQLEFQQPVPTNDTGCYTAKICWAAEHWCVGGGNPVNHTLPTTRLRVQFYDLPGGTGTLLGTHSTGFVNHSAVSQEENELLLSGFAPSGTQSAVMSITLRTPGGQFCGGCGSTGHFSNTLHSASYVGPLGCVPPAAPLAPEVTSPTTTSLDVAIAAGEDGTNKEFAIRINGGSLVDQFVQSGGTIGGTPDWQTKAAWNAGTTVTGLDSGTSYRFDAFARSTLVSNCSSSAGACGFGVTDSTIVLCADNRVTNADFGSSTDWNQWAERGSATFDYNAQDDCNTDVCPAGSGGGPCARVSQSGDFNGGIWTPMTLLAGSSYTVSLLSRDVGSTANMAWGEVVVGSTAPVNGSDYGNACTATGADCSGGVGAGCADDGKLLLKWDTFDCDNWNGDETTACKRLCATFTAPSDITYLVLNNGPAASATTDVSWDKVQVCGPAPCSPDVGDPTITCPAPLTLSTSPATCTAILPDMTIADGTVLADSVADFSSVQGQDDWQYGKYLSFDCAQFTQLPNYNGGSSQWEDTESFATPFLSAANAHPGVDNGTIVVRRWTSDFVGQVDIEVNFEDLAAGGDGVSLRIRKNCGQIWEFLDLDTGDGNVTQNVQTVVNIGDTIDFVVEAKFDNGSDLTRFTAVITADTGLSATDLCDSALDITQSPVAGTVIPGGVTVVTLTATDDASNTDMCNVNVTVVDGEAPVITCPSDANIACGDDESPTNTGTATAVDNCDPTLSIAIGSSDSEVGSCPIVGKTITRTWTATDVAGNSSTCVQTINVAPTACTAPSLTLVESRKTHGGAGTWGISFGDTESRSGGITRVVLQFDKNVTPADGSIEDGDELTMTSNPAAAITISNIQHTAPSDTITFDVAGVVDRSCVTLTIDGIACDVSVDVPGSTMPTATPQMVVLQGDAGNSEKVTSADVNLVKSQAGGVVVGNFRSDINVDGTVDNTDTNLAKGSTNGVPVSCP